jgi:phosphatidate cytidylyltransferase
VEINDIFAFCCGKTLGRHKLCPGTSPGKTVEGAVGAVVLTTALFTLLSGSVFAGTPMSALHLRVGLGVLLSITGQCGDLVMSSIKRDVGTKDFATLLPGHGGFLDRFDSLIFVGPVVLHVVGYIQGIGLDQPVRVFTGG